MIDKIFRIIDLAIISALGIYVFKRFVIPPLHSALKQQALFVENLRSLYKKLRQDQQLVEQEIEAQHALYKELILKIDYWKKVVEEEHNAQLEQKQKYQEAALQERIKVQSVERNLELVRKQITPLLIKTLEKELINYYQDENHTHTYQAHIFKVIKKIKV